MRAIWAGALLLCYLVVTLALLLAGGATLADAVLQRHLLLLVAVAVTIAAPGVPGWLRQWTPLLALLFLYGEVPTLISAAGHSATFDQLVSGWELTLFGGHLSRSWAGAWPFRALSEILHGGYVAYYGIIFVVPAMLQLQKRHHELSEAVAILMLVFLACFACYVAFPVAGPRYEWGNVAAPDGPLRRLAVGLLESRSSRGTAFPSSHVAVSVAQSILALRYFGKRGWWVAAVTALLASGAVYGGFHYVVDVLAGAGFGAALATLGLRITAGATPRTRNQ